RIVKMCGGIKELRRKDVCHWQMTAGPRRILFFIPRKSLYCRWICFGRIVRTITSRRLMQGGTRNEEVFWVCNGCSVGGKRCFNCSRQGKVGQGLHAWRFGLCVSGVQRQAC